MVCAIMDLVLFTVYSKMLYASTLESFLLYMYDYWYSYWYCTAYRLHGCADGSPCSILTDKGYHSYAAGARASARASGAAALVGLAP